MCVKFINHFNDVSYTIFRSLNPLQNGCEKHFLSSLISMGVSKLCHFKGEHSLMDVYHEWANI